MPRFLSFEIAFRPPKKVSLSLNEYLLKIKNKVDRLASVGYCVSVSDHMEAIFNSLPQKYDIFVVSVSARSNSYTIDEIKSLLLAQESRIERHDKELKTLIHGHSNYKGSSVVAILSLTLVEDNTMPTQVMSIPEVFLLVPLRIMGGIVEAGTLVVQVVAFSGW